MKRNQRRLCGVADGRIRARDPHQKQGADEVIWFTLADGNSIAVAPAHVRYVLPTDDGGTIICFAHGERFIVTQTPTEVVAKLG